MLYFFYILSNVEFYKKGERNLNAEKILTLQLSRHILYSYFEKNDVEPLLSSLADDIVWIGTGKHMCLTSYTAVFHAFAAGKNQLVPCIIQNERHLARSLGANYWLCQYTSEIKTKSSTALYLDEHQRCVFIFRRNSSSRNHTGWELAYLYTSLSFNPLQEHELFAVDYGSRNFNQLHHQQTPLSPRELTVARLVAEGRTNKEVASILHVAEITVKKTLSRLYKKLGITNRTALTQYISQK